MEKKKPKMPQIKAKKPRLVIKPDVDVVYANMVRIAHTPGEFVFDFARILPGEPNVPVLTRVLMSPLGTKLLIKALQENLTRYEDLHGEIKVPQKMSLADQLFKPVQSMDGSDDPEEEEEDTE